MATTLRQSAEPLKPAIDPAGWDAAKIVASDDWVYRFPEHEIAEIMDAAAVLESSGKDLVTTDREDFALPKTETTLAAIYDELKNGKGFVQMRGLPVAEISRTRAAAVIWGIGSYFGTAMSQNSDGHVLGHVLDLGKDYNDPMVRGYQTKAAMTFHTDPCDMVALLCLNTAKSGGASRVVSSVTLYNEMLKRNPDFVADLCEDFFWSLHGEFSPGGDPWYKMPVFTFDDGYFSARGASTHARKAQDLPGAEKWSALRNEAVAMFQELTKELAADLPFEQGDFQILNSHVTLHSRRPYEDNVEMERKRHLFRLWIRNDDLRPLPQQVRDNLLGIEVEGITPIVPLDTSETV
ncbi:TauD/TfdA family dioxygenase [Alphaproteobacteria bacterium]|nr:TauD/TfdA family dioxygenase [Alphaproteobacteria bacterium]